MKKGLCLTGLGIKLSLLGVATLIACLAGAALAQENQARMSVEPPAERVKTGGPEFTVNIVAADVTNLAAEATGFTGVPREPLSGANSFRP